MGLCRQGVRILTFSEARLFYQVHFVRIFSLLKIAFAK